VSEDASDEVGQIAYKRDHYEPFLTIMHVDRTE
jgi:hypothetical protein